MNKPIEVHSGVNHSAIKDSGGDRIFTFVNYTVLSLFLLIVLYPLVFILSASFSSTEAVTTGRVWLWPVNPTLEGYEAVFKNKLIWSGFRNSIVYTAVGTFINVVLTILAAYPLARKDLVGRTPIIMLFMFTTMFSGGLIPSYLLVKDLGMLNTMWSLIIPSALGVYNVIIARTYFQTTIPDELLEAAQLDGCNDFRFVYKVVIPLSGPIIAVITLYYAVGHWNQFFNAMLYLKNPSMYPLQLVLRDILIQNQVDATMLADAEDAAKKEGLRELLKYSLIIVATVPLLVVYPFIQKHFVKGVMVGSLKG